MEHRGRPAAGAVAGFLFGGFLGLTLMLFGVFPIGGPWLALAPIGLVLGALWGWWAPLGRTRHRPGPPAVHLPVDTSGSTNPAWTVRPITGEVPVTPPAPPGPVPPPTPVGGSPEVRPGPEPPTTPGPTTSPWPPESPWPPTDLGPITRPEPTTHPEPATPPESADEESE
jgi:hypothetical protein